MKKLKILVSGGHLTPAMAVMDELKDEFEVVFAGRKRALSGERMAAEEERVASKMGVKFVSLAAGRLPKEINLALVGAILSIPAGFLAAINLIFKEKPDLVFSFGGYLGLPLVVAGWLLGIPVMIHEQTRRAGLGNRISAMFAWKILVSFAESTQYFDKNKTVVTGLPIRKEIFDTQVKLPDFLKGKIQDEQILYIMGGVTGAQSLNNLIYHVVPELVKKYLIVHQVGRINLERVPTRLKALDKYIPVGYLSTFEHAYVLQNASLIVSRSGANTAGEIAAVGKVAILVPLPWAANDEQRINAEYLVKAGSTVIFDQQSGNFKKLLELVNLVSEKNEKYRRAARRVQENWEMEGAKNVASEVKKIIYGAAEVCS